MVWLGESINYRNLMVYRAIGGIARYVVGVSAYPVKFKQELHKKPPDN